MAKFGPNVKDSISKSIKLPPKLGKKPAKPASKFIKKAKPKINLD